MSVINIIVGVIGFLVGIAITRAVFSIGKIVRLLEVIAQDLHARNLVDGIDDKLVLTKEVAQELNRPKAALYPLEDQPGGEQPT